MTLHNTYRAAELAAAVANSRINSFQEMMCFCRTLYAVSSFKDFKTLTPASL